MEHKPETNLFVHVDKNIYTNNEQVWFTGYIIKPVVPLDSYHTLYVSLVNNADSTVVLQERYLIQDGFSFGNFSLPDSLISGYYSFVVNTNIQADEKIDGEFVQPLTIRSNTVDNLVPHFSLMRNNNHADPENVILKVLSSDNRFVENAEINYAFGKGKVTSMGIAKTSIIGEALIPYPILPVDSTNNLLSLSIKKGKNKRHIKYDLPAPNLRKYKVKYYPEGGYLVDGLPSNVGFEVRDLQDAPFQSKAYLFENDIIIDTILTDLSGMGKFKIFPKSGCKYYIQLISKSSNDHYELPVRVEQGLVLSAEESIVDQDFRISLLSTYDSKVYAVVHNGNEISMQSELKLTKGVRQKVRFDLDSVKPGLNKVTILDEEFRPLAERIFFAHYDRFVSTNLKTDKSFYKTRDSVRLFIDFNGKDLSSLKGYVSISCAQSNRFSSKNNKSIVDYTFLEKDLGTLPYNFSPSKIRDRSYLDKVLLIKGWRSYKWQRSAINRSVEFSSSEVTGSVLRSESAIKFPMELHTIAKGNINALRTDSSGKFTIPFANLIIDDKADVWLNMNTKNPGIFSIKIHDPFTKIKNHLEQTSFDPQERTSSLAKENDNVKISSGINLKEVVIANKKDDFNGSVFSERPKINRCGDYVCSSNILNCINHAGDSRNRPPKSNGRYRDQDGKPVTYFGCATREVDANISILKGIQLPKDFYRYDITNIDEPISATTIYWNHQIPLNGVGQAAINFATGDLTGEFKIVVQGITNEGPVYAEKMISVVKL
ncbi:hypothetical protein GCM10011387_32840 [Pedobacter quisquiliarum]|uniref:MG2 domain-containing protein n=1 Tax=Pedobacter quisquiliarum TaxID=1834438 RepID=A0A916UKJ6_9SPHI|nr:hypothetical protein GCM10011387_32840 [Pedobacter quisquiliarum]